VRVPEPPGAATVITFPVVPVKAREKSGATVTVMADEVEPV
jgi:hypothetical protein